MNLKIKILICAVIVVCIVLAWYFMRPGTTAQPPNDENAPPVYVDGTWVIRYSDSRIGPYAIKRRDGNIYCYGVPSQGQQVGYCVKDGVSNESVDAANAAIASGAADPFTELLMCSGDSTNYCRFKI
ncbi:hypothetical protein F-S17_0318 [Faustovirus]|nr:hypothetical protein F-M6_0327 [Faustovirus]QJX72584.1 hypothetical protein F-S17_0318 [Faustovirus]QJX73081.1 hypothetical protein F-VV57_0320 [Faustovirus]QJX73588.1 hypothetical protein F-VV63_0322 [Faustovirus]QJX74095.1 hypothetical protein F-E9_341 [Faustovirus]